MAKHFDLAAFELLVDGTFGAQAHHAFDLHTKFIADIFGNLEHIGAVRVTNHLHIAFAVSQIDKDHATMVASAIDPSAQRHTLSLQCFGDQSTVVRSHSLLSSLKKSLWHKAR